MIVNKLVSIFALIIGDKKQILLQNTENHVNQASCQGAIKDKI